MDNVLGKIVYIEHHGTAKVQNAGSSKTPKTGWGAYSKKNKLDKKYHSMGKQTKKTSDGLTTITYTRYKRWSVKNKNPDEIDVKYGTKKHRHKYYYYDTAHIADGFLTSLSGDYATTAGNIYTNCYFCDSATGISGITGAGTFPTPSVCDISFQDIDVEKDDETKKKNVTDVGRGPSGYLTRNRVRANVVKIELEWYFLTASQASKILQILSYGKATNKGDAWLLVCFHNPYTNAIIRKKMYAGDRSLSATYRGNYTSLKVSLVEW